MAEHKEHYPTMIEHPKTHERRQVNTPYDHHKQLLAWKMPGLEPVPAPPAPPVTAEPLSEPGYPKMIENEKTGERARVDRKAEHDQKLASWAAKEQPAKSTTRGAQPAPPPSRTPAKPAATAKTTTSTSKGGKGKDAPMPPTVEELMKKNYPRSIAQRMADEEIRKYNAGLPPYGTNTEG